MTVLVTGASGFVGSRLVQQLLRAGANVAAQVRPGGSALSAVESDRLHVVELDLGNASELTAMLREIQPDACVHLAWYARPGNYLESTENIASLQSSLHLVETLHETGCQHIVAVGTCAEYEMGTKVLSEDARVGPATLYAASKLAFFLLASKRCAQLGMAMAWARLFYLYGPNEHQDRLVAAAINSLLAGRAFATTAGEQMRDYLHVDDVAAALTALNLQKQTGVYNVCSGQPIQVARLLRTVGEIVGRPELIRLGVRPYREWEPMFVCGDNRRLRAATGWAPRIALTQGLAATVEWWRKARCSDSHLSRS